MTDSAWENGIRSQPYYGGELKLELDPEYPDSFRLTWEAYEGGTVSLDFDEYEIARLRDRIDELLEAKQ